MKQLCITILPFFDVMNWTSCSEVTDESAVITDDSSLLTSEPRIIADRKRNSNDLLFTTVYSLFSDILSIAFVMIPFRNCSQFPNVSTKSMRKWFRKTHMDNGGSGAGFLGPPGGENFEPPGSQNPAPERPIIHVCKRIKSVKD